MKQLCLIIIVALTTQFVNAQKMGAIVFSENGEKFTLYLNGVAQNDTPQTNVNLGELELQAYQARVDFEDPTLADFSNNNFILGLERAIVRLGGGGRVGQGIAHTRNGGAGHGGFLHVAGPGQYRASPSPLQNCYERRSHPRQPCGT